MQRCNWCNKPINDSPFLNYCSKKCENEAVAKGERKGVKSSTSAVFFIVIFIIVIGFNTIKKNGTKSQETNENIVEQKYSTDNDNSTSTIEETIIENSVDDTSSQNELMQENLQNDTIKVNESEDQVQSENSKEEIVISLLKEGRSVKEVAEITGLTKPEVRKIKRNLE